MARSGQGGKKPSKGQQRDVTERKRDERAVRNAYRKKRKDEAYLADDENFASFSNQLQLMGLKLRDIPGDGNCLFRALGDQLEGHGRNHFKHRDEAVEYMRQHQDFFEPFMEDNISFEKHLNNLGSPGTYAGNDSIVAFAKRHGVDVVIHQLNLPVWQVSGSDCQNAAREVHISFHNGDHYSSVRSVSDMSNNPTNFKSIFTTRLAEHSNGKYNTREQNKMKEIEKQDAATNSYSSSNIDAVSELQLFVMQQSGCEDLEQIEEALEDNDYDADATITYLLQMSELGERLEPANTVANNQCNKEDSSGLWSEDGTGSRIFGSAANETNTDTKTEPNRTRQSEEGNKCGDAQIRSKVNNRHRKQQLKRERKQRQMDRHRQKILGASSLNNRELSEDEHTTVVLGGEMGALSI